MRESLRILSHCIFELPFSCSDLFDSSSGKIVPPSRSIMKYDMESLIHHFKLYSEGFLIPKNEVYISAEAPKGEFSVFLLSNGTNWPYKMSY
jgi:NADH:ubiquinone oxidoreductase subunit D